MKKGQWPRMLMGLIAVFALFQWSASALGSVRGEAGVLIGLLVVAATLLAERFLFRKSFKEAAKAIGLGRPKRFGMVVAILVSAFLLLMVPIFLLQSGSSLSLFPGWLSLLPGLFFQAGIAEETLFRGYLFGHIRQRHTFWKAASFAAIPFVLVHLILFYSLPWSLAGASILLAIAMSFPLSKLYEMAGDTIWAPAILHFVAQGAVKVIVVSGGAAGQFPFYWIAVSALIPLLVYAVPPLIRLLRRNRWQTAAVRTALFLIIAASGAHAHEESEPGVWSREELTGDWGGKRIELREKGIDLKFRLTQVYQGVAARGIDSTGAYSGKLDTHFRFDLEKLANRKGLSVQIKTETRFGRTPSAGNGLPLNSAVISPESSGTAVSVTHS